MNHYFVDAIEAILKSNLTNPYLQKGIKSWSHVIPNCVEVFNFRICYIQPFMYLCWDNSIQSRLHKGDPIFMIMLEFLSVSRG